MDAAYRDGFGKAGLAVGESYKPPGPQGIAIRMGQRDYRCAVGYLCVARKGNE